MRLSSRPKTTEVARDGAQIQSEFCWLPSLCIEQDPICPQSVHDTSSRGIVCSLHFHVLYSFLLAQCLVGDLPGNVITSRRFGMDSRWTNRYFISKVILPSYCPPGKEGRANMSRKCLRHAPRMVPQAVLGRRPLCPGLSPGLWSGRMASFGIFCRWMCAPRPEISMLWSSSHQGTTSLVLVPKVTEEWERRSAFSNHHPDAWVSIFLPNMVSVTFRCGPARGRRPGFPSWPSYFPGTWPQYLSSSCACLSECEVRRQKGR